MTQENGSVAMAVDVPMIGLVSGTTTMKEIIDGTTSDKADDAPAVVTTPMGKRKVAAVPAVSSGANAGSPAGGAAASPVGGSAASPVKVTPPAPVADDPETKASKLLQLAESYIGSGLKASGVKKLKTIVEKYPDTAAARKAKVLLAGL